MEPAPGEREPHSLRQEVGVERVGLLVGWHAGEALALRLCVLQGLLRRLGAGLMQPGRFLQRRAVG